MIRTHRSSAYALSAAVCQKWIFRDPHEFLRRPVQRYRQGGTALEPSRRRLFNRARHKPDVCPCACVCTCVQTCATAEQYHTNPPKQRTRRRLLSVEITKHVCRGHVHTYAYGQVCRDMDRSVCGMSHRSCLGTYMCMHMCMVVLIGMCIDTCVDRMALQTEVALQLA